MSSNGIEIDGSGDDFDVVEGELGSLSEDDSVQDDHGGTVVVESISVAALLVRVEVDSTDLGKRKRKGRLRREEDERERERHGC